MLIKIQERIASFQLGPEDRHPVEVRLIARDDEIRVYQAEVINDEFPLFEKGQLIYVNFDDIYTS